MKMGSNKLKMSSGEIRSFGNRKKRDNFERVAQAYNHGWRPKKIGKVKKSLVRIGFIKSEGGMGGMSGMTSTSGGAGLIYPQMGSRAALHKKRHKKKYHH